MIELVGDHFGTDRQSRLDLGLDAVGDADLHDALLGLFFAGLVVGENVDATLPFRECLLGRLRNRFSVRPLGRRGSIAERRVRYSPTTNAGVVTYSAVIEVDNPEQKLRPGMGAEAFIVMDKLNYDELIKSGIPAKKIYFLSENEIKDPYKKAIFDYEQIYTQIKHRHVDEIK